MGCSKKYLVLGAGVGKAIAGTLARSADTQLVVIGDMDTERVINAYRFVNKFSGSKRKCLPLLFDAEKTRYPMMIFRQFDVVISALPAKYNLRLAEAAIKAGTHFCDLGGVVDVTRQMLKLNRKYPVTPVSVVPDCGLMPGLGVILAKKLSQDLSEANSLEILVGGLPQKPQPPTFYQKVFNPEGLRHICYDMAPILLGGEIKLVKPFSNYCQFNVPELHRFSELFNGRVEAFVTAGASLAAWSFQNLGVSDFSEKTVRWPGFVDFFRPIPPNRFENVVREHLDIPVDDKNPDLVWMQVTAKEGSRQKSASLLDLYDQRTGLTAMERTTGFTTAVIAEMMAEGKTKHGVNTPENTFDDSSLTELIERVGRLIPLDLNPTPLL